MNSAKHHIVRCRKYRRRVLAGRVEARLKEIIVSTVGGAPLEVVRRHAKNQRLAA
jgi:REP element-mobilizing transposase RayT